MHKFHILINQDSGTVQRAGLDAIQSAIEESPIKTENIHILETEKFFECVKDWEQKGPLLIGGGDGTIKSCAEILSEKGISFGILPLGTMNLLAKDLDIPESQESALNAYHQNITEFSVDVGVVNKETFLCCVGVGTMPEASEFREEHRSKSTPVLIPLVTAYVFQRLDQLKHKMVRIVLDGKSKKVKTSALVVSNNRYMPQKDWTNINFKRNSLQDSILGVYSAAPQSFWDRLRLLLLLQLGNWRKDTSVREWACKTLTIEPEEKDVLVSLDGETKVLEAPLQFHIQPKALSVLIPDL